jgi:2-polyprenyl-3-methyl-5-hydroxy-6-metoxy-1,4-benzoquinol methylase
MVPPKVRRGLRRVLGQSEPAPPVEAAPVAPPAQNRDAEIANLRYEVDYLLLEVSRLRSLVRHLTAGKADQLPLMAETKESFDFQWDATVDGNWIDTRPELKEREPRIVCEYTRLPREWFAGKRALDAGCGSGRFTYAMASMGATVTAVDQSAAGVAHTRRAAAEFGDRVTVKQHDLTQPLDLPPQFDLVWSYGVLHHTGDTYGAFRNIARLVKPGGYLFMMLYGEPTGKDAGAFAYYTEVERLRRDTAAMNFTDRHAAITAAKGADAGGWFDAVSPRINDTYSFYEIELWLIREGFTGITRTIEHSSHHVIAQRPEAR